jgi:hypothetical protein
MSMQAFWAVKCLTLLTAVGAAACTSSGVARAEEQLIEVMILATIHMENPNRDIHNTPVPDVLLPQYQAQILQVTDALAQFKPTQVHVESLAESVPDAYALYLADKSPPSRSETEQVAPKDRLHRYRQPLR